MYFTIYLFIYSKPCWMKLFDKKHFENDLTFFLINCYKTVKNVNCIKKYFITDRFYQFIVSI